MFSISIQDSVSNLESSQDSVRRSIEVKHTELNPVLSGAIETLEQGHQFLAQISDAQYCHDASPHLSSTIGEHFRHWLDIFHALFYPQHQFKVGNHIDYNQRRRGHEVEELRHVAMAEISGFIVHLKEKDAAELLQPVMILTEVSLSKSEVCAMNSTFERELTFAALHANHHFAMAKIIMTLLDVKTNDSFGLAPATASFIRGQ